MLKAYKYRIYPNKRQQELIEKHFGCARFIYNLALETKINAYRSAGKSLSAFGLGKQLVDLKQDCKWLYEVSHQSLINSLRNLDAGYNNFFRTKRGFPKFKSKYSQQSFQVCKQGSINRIDFENNQLHILKIKDIKIKISKQFKGEIKTVTISKTPTNKYFASILVDTNIIPANPKPIKESTTVGIDLGLKHFIITSDGIKVDNPKFLKNDLPRLKVLQRRLSNKKKGSNNRNKARLRVARQHEKIANKRLNFLHKLSYELIRKNQTDTICVESLAIGNMVKNHKLAQAISDVGWGEFVRQLEYKCKWYGINFVKIGRFEPSSKLCSNCGTINETLTLKDREWVCAECGTLHDRDINAAKNIKIAGLKKLTGLGKPAEPVELLTVVGTEKQECLNYK